MRHLCWPPIQGPSSSAYLKGGFHVTAKTPNSNTRSKLQAVKKLPTGISGLDVVLQGGIPRGRTTALVGGPGGGKTSLCTNIAANCAGRGEACLYLSFEMSHQATARDAASLGFDLPALEKQGSLVFVDGRPVLGQQKSGEFDLGGLLALVKGLSREKNAELVILDALEVLLQHFNDPDQQIQALRQLHIWLEENNFTSLITARAPAQAEGLTNLGQVEFMCDCLIYVDQRVEQELTTRRLRVIKYRGSDTGRNEYPFVIAPGGIKLIALSNTKLDRGPLTEDGSQRSPGIGRDSGRRVPTGLVGAFDWRDRHRQDHPCLYLRRRRLPPGRKGSLRGLRGGQRGNHSRDAQHWPGPGAHGQKGQSEVPHRDA